VPAPPRESAPASYPPVPYTLHSFYSFYKDKISLLKPEDIIKFCAGGGSNYKLGITAVIQKLLLPFYNLAKCSNNFTYRLFAYVSY
jgi:hypothetical protein